MIDNIVSALGDKADYLLKHTSKTVSKDQLHLPGPDFSPTPTGTNAF